MDRRETKKWPEGLPEQPRLADHVACRLHTIDGHERIVVVDESKNQLIFATERELDIIMLLDGVSSREIILSRAQERGIHADEITDALCEMFSRGMLNDGRRSNYSKLSPENDVSIEYLPDFGFKCRRLGAGCCTTYNAIIFSRAERENSQRLNNMSAGNKLFLPIVGSVHDESTVKLVNGRCHFLDDQNACSLHDSRAKPLGCQLYPFKFVHVGSTIRCAPVVECACVLASVDASDQDQLFDSANIGLLQNYIERAPERIVITKEKSQSLVELKDWTLLVESRLRLRRPDVLSMISSLISDISCNDDSTREPRLGDKISSMIPVILHKITTFVKFNGKWRSRDDRTQIIGTWLQQAVLRLINDSMFFAQVMLPRISAHETFYLRAGIFSFAFLSSATLVEWLYGMALKIVIARACAFTQTNDIAQPYPITVVEQLSRAYGLMP